MKRLALPAAALLAMMGLAAGVVAQIESGERGVTPLDSSGSYEVSGISVDVVAGSAAAARLGGWKLAQRRGWQMLWSKMHGGRAGAPALGDDALNAMIAGIVVEDEQIGPNRYVAKLGVLFDRARAGAILGVSGQMSRSAPMLVIPVEWSGGTARSFEARTDWQKAWARFRAGSSPIDYVRPSGTGSDPLLLNLGQTQRPGRNWWRMLLDQYGAADVLVPQVRLERRWPGGPVVGHFVARHGPDNRVITTFTLSVDKGDKLDAMLDEGVRRIDRAYTDALAMGLLRPDPSLIEQPVVDPGLLSNTSAPMLDDAPLDEGDTPEPASAPVTSFTVQFETPDVASVSGTEATMRGVPGVRGLSTSSLALGGTSVMRVEFAGDLATLRLALEARGFRVEEGGGTLRIRRPTIAPVRAAPPAPPPPAEPTP